MHGWCLGFSVMVYRSENVVRYLLHAGADVHLADRESCWTPLHRALYHGQLRCALLLLSYGAILGDSLAPWNKGVSW